MVDQACFDAAKKAAAGKLTDREVADAFKRVTDYRERLARDGNVADQPAAIRRFVIDEVERTRIAAAMQRRHAAINAMLRDKLDTDIKTMMDAGLTAKQALLALQEGTSKGVAGGRNSIGATNLAYEAKLIGGMLAEIQSEHPHLVRAMRDKRMDNDVTREMAELRENGKPGITGNRDAEYIAKVFATYAELARTTLNRLGASIGKLDGWSGVQVHDDIKLITAGKDEWISSTLPKLDVVRTFPDAATPSDIREMMSGIYDTIITGMPAKMTPREKGERINPANLAKSLGKSRVLHFKDAQASISYRDQFGYGNTVSGMIAHLRNASRMAAVMERLGPNPELMMGSLVDSMARRIKEDPTMSPADKKRNTDQLKFDAGGLRHAFDIATGLNSKPVNVSRAKIATDIRAAQSMAKLGAALFSSVTDNVTAGLASMFRGSGFFRGFTSQLAGITRGRPAGEVAEISYLLGEGFDGIIGHIVNPAAAVDGPAGKLAALQEKFFRWNGLSWWTDIQRATAGRMIAAEMGMRSATPYDRLPANYRHVLGLHAITEEKWEAIRQAGTREVNGRRYITPDLIRDLDDSVIEPLVQDRIDAARKLSRVDEAKSDEVRERRQADFERRREAVIEDGRRDLELSHLAFVADETGYAVIESDVRSRRTMTFGTRPGTVAGEAARFVMQFKGFPTAFTQRIIGRTIFGQRPDASYAQRAQHIGALIVGMTMAGYVGMTLKDMMRGYWPPRDPTDPKTWGAALVQGGAAGIYGDFLFSRVSRFGTGPLETAVGPTLGAGFDALKVFLASRDAALGVLLGEETKMSAGDALNLIINNTPLVNLFYVRPALDILILNAMKEAISPGYLKRQEGRRRAMGQRTMPILGDRMAF
jgi:hypothetical protein